MNINIESNPEDQSIEILEVSAVTPHNSALYEAGKSLLIDSVSIGRDFCKYMISLSSSAIPIYLGLLGFVLPEYSTLSLKQGIFAILPSFLFLISTAVFTLGYLPKTGNFSLNIINEISGERAKTINRRNRLTWIGFGIFLAGIVTALISIVASLWSV